MMCVLGACIYGGGGRNEGQQFDLIFKNQKWEWRELVEPENSNQNVLCFYENYIICGCGTII